MPDPAFLDVIRREMTRPQPLRLRDPWNKNPGRLPSGGTTWEEHPPVNLPGEVVPSQWGATTGDAEWGDSSSFMEYADGTRSYANVTDQSLTGGTTPDPVKTGYKREALKYANLAGINPMLFLAQIDHENPMWDPSMTNDDEAKGLAQIVTHAWQENKAGEWVWKEQHPAEGIRLKFWEGKLDPYDPKEAFEYASLWMKALIKEARDAGASQMEAVWKALSYYNAGSDTVDGGIYARDVFRRYAQVEELSHLESSSSGFRKGMGTDEGIQFKPETDRRSDSEFVEAIRNVEQDLGQTTPFSEVLRTHLRETPIEIDFEKGSTLSGLRANKTFIAMLARWGENFDGITNDDILRYNGVTSPEDLPAGTIYIPTTWHVRHGEKAPNVVRG